MNESAFTVFTKCGCWQNSGPEVGRSVAEICAWLVDDGWVPVAWIEGNATEHKGDDVIDRLRESSIAAGRTIQNVDGKWIAFGAPVEEWKARDLNEIMEEINEIANAASKANAGMISRDGNTPSRPAPVVIQRTNQALPAVAGLAWSSDYQASGRGHQVLPGFGSASLRA